MGTSAIRSLAVVTNGSLLSLRGVEVMELNDDRSCVGSNCCLTVSTLVFRSSRELFWRDAVMSIGKESQAITELRVVLDQGDSNAPNI